MDKTSRAKGMLSTHAEYSNQKNHEDDSSKIVTDLIVRLLLGKLGHVDQIVMAPRFAAVNSVNVRWMTRVGVMAT